MKKLTNNGFTKFELIVCLTVFLILIAVGVKVISDKTGNDNYKAMARQAKSFSDAVSLYKDYYTRDDGIYYLRYLEGTKYYVEIVDPFDRSKKCNEFESYVSIDKNLKKEVHLVCGNHIAEGVIGEKLKVYETTEWSNDANTSNDSAIRYNYLKDSVLVSDKYVTEKEIISIFINKEGKDIGSLSEITGDNIKLDKKTLYRSKKLIETY